MSTAVLLDADKPLPVEPPTDRRWLSKWPSLAQSLPVLLVWGFSLLAIHVHPFWDYAGFGLVTVWALWLSADIAFGPSNPRRAGHSRTRRIVHALVIMLLWLTMVAWYLWPFGVQQ